MADRWLQVRDILGSIAAADHPDRLYLQDGSHGTFNLGLNLPLPIYFPLPYLGLTHRYEKAINKN